MENLTGQATDLKNQAQSTATAAVGNAQATATAAVGNAQAAASNAVGAATSAVSDLQSKIPQLPKIPNIPNLVFLNSKQKNYQFLKNLKIVNSKINWQTHRPKQNNWLQKDRHWLQKGKRL
jgi:regulator of protease activity HflC (stomatin/prohibitin superfamily)